MLKCKHVRADDCPECKAERAPRIRESQIQQTVVDGLRAAGYVVLVTNAALAPVTVGGKKHYSRGHLATPGVPDLLISHQAWPPALWFGLEMKGEKTAVSPEQRHLADLGRIAIARSWEDAVDWLDAFECRNHLPTRLKERMS